MTQSKEERALHVIQQMEAECTAAYAAGKPIAELLLRRSAQMVRVLAPSLANYVSKATVLDAVEIDDIAKSATDAAEMATRTMLLTRLMDPASAASRNALAEVYNYAGILMSSEPDAVIVAPDLALCESLIATDFGAVSMHSFRWPVPRSLVVRVPRGLLQSRDPRTGWHDVEVMVATPLRYRSTTEKTVHWAGEGLSCLYRCGPNAQSASYEDDHYRIDFLPTKAESSEKPQTLDELLAQLRYGDSEKRKAILGTRVKRDGEWVEEPYACENLLVGTVFYLTMPSASVTRPSNGKRVPIEELREAPRQRVKVRGKEPASKWLTYRLGADEKPRVGYKHLVRGHWKQAAYGPRMSLRKLLWVRPYVRHPIGPGNLGEREYEVTS